ncbi:recombination protein U [Enterococcus sp. PF1-24]|uniref:Holliday junction resolvase RecU n=1 Tax=unclassified Enterococcus TaxID=2608891 RepID=UPI002476EFAD|nr:MULTISPECIES: Holliday junction resolvase RecU [unclassified Enterococcus]MDH6365155.1 recombination protein U [Enterococcus sp. PFB1-1]MDH6402261.1 recombination protein U [Enterococcus sp. PF1-24]
MVFHYPNGQPHLNNAANLRKSQAKEKINFANRGMNFEEAINQSNDYYLNHQIAVIHKKPTPIQIVKVDYPRRSAAVIKEAYFRHASTTDYNGVYQGFYLDFEAKETKNKTSFPLKNFHEHQIKHMQDCLAQKGICFVLMWFSSLNRCFFLSAEILINYWHLPDGKSSIYLKQIEEEGFEITMGVAPVLPYLKAVDQFIASKN